MSPPRESVTPKPGHALGAVSLHYVRCFESCQVDFDPRVTVLIGQNGAGKTTIVEALAALSSGDDEGLDAEPHRPPRTVAL